jgi:hypothetical protein
VVQPTRRVRSGAQPPESLARDPRHEKTRYRLQLAPSGRPVDELTALLASRSWVRRRVDRLEFLDLNTVHRKIVFTLDLKELRRLVRADPEVFPVGLLRRDAMRAGTRMVDGSGNVLAHLPRVISDRRVESALKRRLDRLDIAPDAGLIELLTEIQNHRARSCALLSQQGKFDGCADLAAEKWGCPAVGRLLMRLQAAEGHGADPVEVAELARVLFDWQNNYVLFVAAAATELSSMETLEVSYDEELAEWQPPWERRIHALGQTDLSGADAESESVKIGRAPFGEDLDRLVPDSALEKAAAENRKSLRLRKLGRRGVLSFAWHVAWEQASSRDVGLQLVEVALPAELAVIRLRMVEATLVKGDTGPRRDERVSAAPLSTGQASLLAPTPARDQPTQLAPLVGMFMSLVVAQRRRGAWLAGSATAAVTGTGMVVGALADLSRLVAQAGTVVTILLLAPTFVAAVLSIRAASEISQELTQPLRVLIALIGVLTVACAISLVLSPTASPTLPTRLLGFMSPDVHGVEVVWLVAGALLVAVAVILFYGWVKLGRQLTYSDPLASGREEPVTTGRALLAGAEDGTPPPKAPRIPPPDRWIETGEGDRLPWGWLWFDPSQAARDQTRAGRGWEEDHRYWNSVYADAPVLNVHEHAKTLVEWRERLFLG